jgi:hypothetical protein
MLVQMHRPGIARRLPLAGAAVAGAVVGHTLAWTLTVPEPAARLALLATSGHTYWSAAIAAAIVLGLASLAATLARHFRAGLGAGRRPAGEPFWPLAGRLALLQVGIYLVQEVLERTAAGAPLGDAIDGRLLLFGVTVQVAVALGLAAVLAWVGRVAEVAGEALRRRHLPRVPSRSALPLPRPAGWVRPVLLRAAGLGGRAPPIG